MKNLPEKIYLNLNMTPQEVVETKDKDFHETTKTWEITWSEECLSEHDPEYVLKDAFIEKAMKFMEKIDDVDEYSWYNEEEHAAGITEECIEDFKNYLKGE